MGIASASSPSPPTPPAESPRPHPSTALFESLMSPPTTLSPPSRLHRLKPGNCNSIPRLRVFQFATIIGIFILLPFNYMGNQLNVDFTDLPNKSLDTFSISNVNEGSNRLWIHFSAVYIFTAVVCYLLYSEYDYIAALRISYFYSSKPQPNQFTALVRSIPVTSGKSFSESVESFFSRCYPSTYLSHSVIHRTDKLKGLINKADNVYKGLVQSKDATQKNSKRGCCFGIFGQKAEPVDQYEKNLEDLEGNMRAEQLSVIGEPLKKYSYGRMGEEKNVHDRKFQLHLYLSSLVLALQ